MLAILASGFATASVNSKAGAAAQASHWSFTDLAASGMVVKTFLTASDLRALSTMPTSQQRRRLDVALDTHADDLLARIFRTQLEAELQDYPAVLVDSEISLATSSPYAPVRLPLLNLRAEALIQCQRAGEAVKVAEQALAINNADPVALFAHAWARYLSTSGQEDSEIAELDRALQLAPNEWAGYYRRANIFIARADFDRAETDLEHALQLAPDDAPSRTLLGAALIEKHDFARALEQLDAAVRLEPDSPSPWAWRSQANLQLGHPERATADATQSIKLGAADEDLSQALMARAAAWVQQGSPQDALRDLDRASSTVPRAETFLFSATLRLDMNDVPGAERDVARALALDGKNPRGLTIHALTRAKQGDAATAAAEARQALALAPDDLLVHFDAYHTFAALKQFEPALQQINAVIELTAGSGMGWLERAGLYEDFKHYAEAVADYTHVVDAKLTPNLDAVRFQRGTLRYQLGDLAGAAADFRATSDTGASQAKARLFLAITLQDGHDFAGAAREFQRALELNPDPATERSLGSALFYSGQFARAIPLFREQLARPKASSYVPLFLFIAQVRANPADEPAASIELTKNLPAHEPRIWVDILENLILGKSDLATALVEADAAPAEQRRGQRCEANFYAAERLLMHGQATPAGPLLEEAHNLCPSTYFEYTGSVAERLLLQAAAR